MTADSSYVGLLLPRHNFNGVVYAAVHLSNAMTAATEPLEQDSTW